ncbi:polysaccharide deacetylase family protein [Flavobacterium sp. MR2016-29]|uniref:polysaccharide deacetylase family protein n=1 Tax=Flavobacterium sp. MR2016-29 TaxID=2783795 RepID=UPI00188CD072|nr:polysaccharide deacetylase family protein [Flavobacterium sp. MR2016-29]MBF4492868.1 polysaccharide deacetylase family protein [Flavobacterium sp. MR2016-29]
MKSKLKKIYYKLLKLKNRILHGRPVLVTMYHRVSDVVGDKLTHLTVSVANFENQLVYYKENYQILRLDEDWNSLKKTGLVITFDDGYADNIINALPLLEKYQIPATIFITTLNINTKNEFWWDRLVFDYANCDELFDLPDVKNKVSKSNTVYNDIIDKLNKLSNPDKENWLVEFEKMNQIPFFPREEYRSLTNAELKFLSDHPLITLGIHSHNHYSLGNLSYKEQKQELIISLKKLNELTNRNIKYLALPHGSYNLDTIKIAQELGFLGVLLANNYYSNKENKASRKMNRILMPNIKDEVLLHYLKKYDFRTW